MNSKKYFVIVLIILLTMFTLNSCDHFKDQKYTLEIGEDAPIFLVNDFKNNETINLEDLKGKIILLHFWALWCPPCIHEMPTINKLAKEINNDSFKILAITVDSKKQNLKIKDFIEEHKLYNLSFIHDYDFEIAKLYQVTGFPESILIDSEGKIAGIYDSVDGKLKSRIIADRNWTDPKIIEFINGLLPDLQ